MYAIRYVLLVCAALSFFLVSAPQAMADEAWSCGEFASTPEAEPESPPDAESVVFPAGGGDLTVFAAASLSDAFTQIKTVLESEHPGLSLTMSFAGSQSLVTQTSEGAPADVLALANTETMDRAIEDGMVTTQPQVFASNELTIVVPTDNPAQITSALDLANDGVRLVMAGPAVPAGRYARESLCRMRIEFGDAFVNDVADNIVSEENDVRAVLTKVALGEADAGIVYRSDVTEDVIVVAIPDTANVRAAYPIAPVAKSDSMDLAEAFIAFVRSPQGQAIMADYEFGPPS